ELRWMVAPVVAVIKVGQDLPNLFFRLAFSDPEGRNLEPRFNYPRRRDNGQKLLYLIGVKDPDKFGPRHSGAKAEISHSQLVAKSPHVRASHSVNLQVFAGQGTGDHVKLVQTDDPPDHGRTKKVSYRTDVFRRLGIVRNGHNIVYRGPNPRRI